MLVWFFTFNNVSVIIIYDIYNILYIINTLQINKSTIIIYSFFLSIYSFIPLDILQLMQGVESQAKNIWTFGVWKQLLSRSHKISIFS